MTQKIYSEQLSIKEILSESWKYFSSNFQLILIITLIVYIPVNSILAVIPTDDSVEGVLSYMRIIQILETFVGIIALMAVAYVVKNAIDGKPITVEEAFRKSMSKWGASVWTNIVSGFFLLGLALLLLIPGIVFYIYWIFASFIVLFHNKSGKKALDYSKTIVKGRWWTIFRYALCFGLLALVVGLLGALPFFFLPEHFFTILISDTVIDIVLSYFVVVSTVFFINFDSTKQTETEN